MSTPEIPDRTISGLSPRRPRAQAAALVRENRPEGAARPVVVDEPEPVIEPAAAPPAPRAARPTTTSSSGRSQLNADVPPEVKARARAAFRAAAHFEGVGSFGEFVTKALEAEIARIERVHNDGRPLEPVTDNLPAGRKG